MNLTWSRSTAPLLGLAYATESRHLMTWADPPEITLSLDGKILHQRQAAQPLRSGACSASGSVFAVVSKTGRLWLLGPNLRTRWELQLPAPAVVLALDPLGDLLAVADTAGYLHLLQAANGKALWRVESPRPLHHLAFVPERPLLVGAADTGLIEAYDPAGNLRWRHGLAAHIGSLAVQGNGHLIALAGYSEGPYCYDANGHRRKELTRLGPCRRLDLSYDGRLVLVETPNGSLVLATTEGVRLHTYTPSGRVLDVALDALGERIIVAHVAGGLLELRFPS